WSASLGALPAGLESLLRGCSALSVLWMPALLPVASRLLLCPALLSMSSGSPPYQSSLPLGSSYIPGLVFAAFIICPNEKVAKEITRAMVEKRLAACINLIPQVTSIRMEGKDQGRQVPLLIETESSLVPALTNFTK
uniref:CutA divalent cation tolerance homolog n=1 Tax=Otolemur garnettii TaxID=30611 RepID=H0XMB6_OTOGA